MKKNRVLAQKENKHTDRSDAPYFAKQPVFYVCDMKKCKSCAAAVGGPCHHTSDIRHAKYPAPHEFERFGTFLFEKERKDNGPV